MKSHGLLGLGACVVIAIESLADPTVPYQVQSVEWSQIPGFPEGQFWGEQPQQVVAGPSGFCAFVSNMHQVPSNQDVAIWASQAGSLSLVAREGDALPAGGVMGPEFQWLTADRAANLAFGSILLDGTRAIVTWDGSSLQTRARTLQQAPDLPSGVLYDAFLAGSSSVPYLALNSGTVVFQAYLQGPGVPPSNKALFRSNSSGTSLIAREGDPVPGAPGTTFLSLSSSQAVLLNHASAAMFNAVTMPGAVHGVWLSFESGDIQSVAASGQQAPGLADGVIFSAVDGFGITASTNVLVFGILTGPGITPDNNTGLWFGPPGDLRPIARKGDHVPGLPEGVAILGFANRCMSNEGEVIAVSLLAGPGVDSSNQFALCSFSAAGPSLIARQGSQAPHTSPGTVFGNFLPNNLMQVNGAGGVAFATRLLGPGVTSQNWEIYYYRDLSGALRKLIRSGEQIDLGDSGIANFRDLYFTPFSRSDDGLPSSLNSRGDLVALVFASIPGQGRNSVVAFSVDELRCVGDVDADCLVGLADIAGVISLWGATVTPGTVGDADFDGQVGLSDIAAIVTAWGADCR